MLTIGDFDFIHLAFRRLVGVLIRCHTPSVVSWVKIWSRSWLEAERGGRVVYNAVFVTQERDGSTEAEPAVKPERE